MKCSLRAAILLAGAGMIALTATHAAIFADESEQPPSATSADTSGAKSAAVAGNDADARQDLLYVTQEKMAILRFHIRIDGRGFQLRLDDYAQKLFGDLDRDANGQLDTGEAARIPPAVELAPREAKPYVRRLESMDFDSDPEDRLLSFAEFKRYIRHAAGTPFTIAMPRQPTTVQFAYGGGRVSPPDLFRKLDTNADDVLDEAELQAGQATLRNFDIDDDEMINAAELQPTPGSPVYVAQTEADSSPDGNLGGSLVIIDSEAPIAAIQKLIQTYDTFGRDRVSGAFLKDGRLNSSELRIDEESLALFDADNDGTLNRSELATLLRNWVPDVEIVVELGTSDDADSGIHELSHNAIHDDGLIQAGTEGDQRFLLDFGDVTTEVHADLEGASERNNPDLFKQQFQRSDRDNNDYLDAEELVRSRFPAASFSTIDGDGDGKIFVKEFLSYVDRQLLLANSRTTLVVSSDNVTPFEMVDTSRDNRLSVRELNQLSRQLRLWDENDDGEIARSEIPEHVHLSFRTGDFNVPGRVVSPTVRKRVAPRLNSRATDLPAWFRKMDRNRDGDVSRREFLGPRKLFKTADADGDGLLDPKEARVVDTRKPSDVKPAR